MKIPGVQLLVKREALRNLSLLLAWPPLAGGERLLPLATLRTTCSPLRQFPPSLFREVTFSQTREVSHWSLPSLLSGTAMCPVHQYIEDTHHTGGTTWETGTSPQPSSMTALRPVQENTFFRSILSFHRQHAICVFLFWSLWGQLCQKGPSLGIQTQCERHRAGGYVHVTLAAGRVHHKRKKGKANIHPTLPSAPAPQRICPLPCFGLFLMISVSWRSRTFRRNTY